ncbi:hypothetical protein [Herbaspirillum robiniae]|uniref:hypothetical protein n=1 Tax=Herbaspirillum robiniae TaxID=2014887 RepID=UPI00101AE89B|nr:hypothetical protein [Herbaspirillum robiniae]
MKNTSSPKSEAAKIESDILENTRSVSSRYAAESIQHRSIQELVEIQSLLLQGSIPGQWTTPDRWLIGDANSRKRMSSLDIKKRILYFLSADNRRIAGRLVNTAFESKSLIEIGVLQATRSLILMRQTNINLSGVTTKKPLNPRTVMSHARAGILPMIAQAITEFIEINGKEFDSIASESLLQYFNGRLGLRYKKSIMKSVDIALKRLYAWNKRGLWSDVPILKKIDLPTAITSPPLANEPSPQTDPHLPLPDEYVAEMAFKCIWLQENLAPIFLPLLDKVIDTWRISPGTSGSALTIRFELIRSIVKEWHKKFLQDAAPPVPPFKVDLDANYSIQELLTGNFPADDKGGFFMTVWAIAALLQQSSLFILSLCTAPRRSETMSWLRSVLIYEDDDQSYVEGKIYKYSDRIDGMRRTWPLPELPLLALKNQIALATAIDQFCVLSEKPSALISSSTPPEQRPLWIQISARGDAGQLMSDINAELRALAITLNMSIRPGDQNLRSHRFRPTLVRLGALAILHSPALLMDVFHLKSASSALYYALSNPALSTEIDKVLRELRLLTATEVVEDILSSTNVNGAEIKHADGYGGKAATQIRLAIDKGLKAKHRHGEDWGAEDTETLVQLLTIQGKYWRIVRKGVICTQLPGEESPCNRGNKGNPEPANCSSSCTHRLEERFLSVDVDQAIEAAVKEYEVSRLKHDDLMTSHWAGQIKAHVPRFPELEEKWLQHPTVKAIFKSE